MKFVFKVIVVILLAAGFFYFFVGRPPRAEKITWGVYFSHRHAQNMGLDWREAYAALLDDLKVRELRLPAYWDLTEPEEGRYDFGYLDWLLARSSERGAKVILVAGLKMPRWPECYAPPWARDLGKEEQQEKLLSWLETVVLRYKDGPAIWAWQIENEPFLKFGVCPSRASGFLKEEVDLVKKLDSRPVIVTASGEWSTWWTVSRFADIPGSTLYKRVWFDVPFLPGFYAYYPFPPKFYYAKADLVRKFFDKEIIITELQAEPWGPNLLYELPYDQHGRTMDLEKFKDMVEFARNTGLSTFYLWGSEWWYWLKTVQNDPGIWDEAGKLW